MPKQRRDIPWLGQRGDVWYANWYDQTERRTKSLSLRTTDQVQAHIRFAAFLTEGRAVFEPEREQGLTVTTALDDYYREHVVVNVVDQSRESRAIEHLKKGFGNMLLKDVDIPACRRYLNMRKTGSIRAEKSTRMKTQKGVADATVRKELTCLRAAAGHARRWKRITAAEMPSIELPTAPHREAGWLTHDEFDKVLASASGELRDFILLAYYTGSRKTAIETLTVFQIDLAHNRLNLAKAGEKRTRKRRPIVPIDPAIRDTLARLVDQATACGKARLFPFDFKSYGRFRRLMTRLGLSDKANPHVLRHSRATHLLQDGVSIYDVARLLGDTVETVERVYGHHSTEYLERVLTKARK
jgi:integrase